MAATLQCVEDRVAVGLDCGSHSYLMDSEAIGVYVRGLREPNPMYLETSPFGGPIAPSLIRHSEVYLEPKWYLPNLHGFLHARQEFELFAPLMAGERVTTHTFVAERYSKRDRDYVVCESLVIDSDGRVCVRGRTHQSFLNPAAAAQPAMITGSQRPGRKFAVGEQAALEDIAPLTKTVDMEMCRDFSGPRVNLHNDLERARAFGFPNVLVQGMFSVCLLSEQLTRRFGAGWIGGGKMAVSLVNPVWLDETIVAKARVIERTREGGRERAMLEVWCEKSDGTVVVLGSASAVSNEANSTGGTSS